MPRNLLVLLAVIGVSACNGPDATDAGICFAQGADVAALRLALETHPETPDAVGEAGTNVVIGFEAACR